jgi:hypothetical protein
MGEVDANGTTQLFAGEVALGAGCSSIAYRTLSMTATKLYVKSGQLHFDYPFRQRVNVQSKHVIQQNRVHQHSVSQYSLVCRPNRWWV